ncbi:MAG: hypothetical protein R3335_07575 [Anaerolineales bacterium]|nr:hypothetical protein [Anaerolineales bacterium]
MNEIRRTALIFIILVSVGLVAASFFQASKCTPQMGQVEVTIPAGETLHYAEVPVPLCPYSNIQLSGGSALAVPVILNGYIHHGTLVIRVHLTEADVGPVDVTIWWQTSYSGGG